MMKSYALWELRTNNLIRDLDNEHDALSAALRFIELNGNGQDTIDNLSLTVEDERGEGDLIAYGQELAELARQKLQSTRRAS